MTAKIVSNIRFGIRTKDACKLAELRPARFNEMVHAKYYRCAPKTTPGAVRLFDRDETATLIIFGGLLSMDVIPERAGQIACLVYQYFANQERVGQLVYKCDRNGDWCIEEEGAPSQKIALFSTRLVFDIAELRKQIEDQFPSLKP